MATSTSQITVPSQTPRAAVHSRPSDGAGRLLPPLALLAILADLLFRAPAMGLNLSLCTGAATLAWWFERGAASRSLGRAERALLLVALLLAVGFSWRENLMLRFLDILGIAVVFALLPFAAAVETRGTPAVLSLGRLLSLFGAMASRGVRGPVPALLDAGRREAGQGGAPSRRPILAAFRGLALGAPLVLVFGSLLGSADPHFGGFLQSLVRIDFSALASHTVGIGVGAWVSAALIGGVLLVEQQRAVTPLPGVSRSLGMIELGLTLGMLDLLFGGFIAFQLPYFFGGAEVVLAREGLTFADYARRGFAELVAVSALVLPLLLVLEPRVDDRARGVRTCFRWLAQLTVMLLVVIMGSALHRMSLYTSQYGLTTDRFFATAFIVGIGVTAAWFSVTVLRGATGRFLPGAIAAWIAWLGALHLVNPERVVVETNMERVAVGRSFDISYLFTLSSDAVPAVLAGEDRLAARERERMQRYFAEMADRGQSDWRAWHYGRANARRLLDRSGSPPSS